jgi:hypothetical protein
MSYKRNFTCRTMNVKNKQSEHIYAPLPSDLPTQFGEIIEKHGYSSRLRRCEMPSGITL